MKTIKIEETLINEKQLKLNGDSNKNISYIDLIEYTLDVIPQGGFTPKDIRDRNRIQDNLDKYIGQSDLKDHKGSISFEDSDFENLKDIVKSSRWTIRTRDIHDFLNIFE